MRSIQAVTFPSLYDILMLMFNSHYIPVTIILKQAGFNFVHSHLLQVISKQAAFIVSQSHLLLFLVPMNLPPSL